VKVLIADDQALVRVGLRMILEYQADMEGVAEAADGEEALAAVRVHRPDVVLMDVKMPKLNGLEASRRIADFGDPTTKVLILTTFDLDEYVYDALRDGASGFLLKDARPAQLIEAVRGVMDGDALLAPSVTRRLVEKFMQPSRLPAAAALLGRLTPRRNRSPHVGRARAQELGDRRCALLERVHSEDPRRAAARQTRREPAYGGDQQGPRARDRALKAARNG